MCIFVPELEPGPPVALLGSLARDDSRPGSNQDRSPPDGPSLKPDEPKPPRWRRGRRPGSRPGLY